VGRKAGLSDEKLLGVAEIASEQNLAIFSRKEKLVIELADAMANTPAEISDELYGRLSQEFSPEQLLELAAQIAFENYRARLNRVFNVQSDHLYSPNQIPNSLMLLILRHTRCCLGGHGRLGTVCRSQSRLNVAVSSSRRRGVFRACIPIKADAEKDGRGDDRARKIIR
jgi:hypothetical protein